MIQQINVAKLSGYTQIDSLLQEMLLGGQDNAIVTQSLHAAAVSHDNGFMASPPSSPGSPPALALVNHHAHPPVPHINGGYLTPPMVSAGGLSHHGMSMPPPPIQGIDPCYNAHLA